MTGSAWYPYPSNIRRQLGYYCTYRHTLIWEGFLQTFMNDKVDTEAFKEFARLRELRISHRDLDDLIDRLSHDPLVDQLRIRRLKKRRLILKDMIASLESELIPDLDA